MTDVKEPKLICDILGGIHGDELDHTIEFLQNLRRKHGGKSVLMIPEGRSASGALTIQVWSQKPEDQHP